jgi:hypothetical protein
VRLENDPKYMYIKSLAFLYDSYEPKFWFMEVVDTIRKQLLTGCLIVFGQGTLTQIVVSMLICLASIRIYSGCNPYIKERVDLFAELTQWQIFFVMLAALLLRFSEMSGEFEIKNKSAFDTILVLTQALAPTIMIMLVLIKGHDVGRIVIRKITGSTSGLRDKEGGGVQLTEFKSGVEDVLEVDLGVSDEFAMENQYAGDERLKKKSGAKLLDFSKKRKESISSSVVTSPKLLDLSVKRGDGEGVTGNEHGESSWERPDDFIEEEEGEAEARE